MNYSFPHCFLPWDSMDLHKSFSLCIFGLFLLQHSYDFNTMIGNMNALSEENVCVCACVFVLLAESQVNHKIFREIFFNLFPKSHKTTLKSNIFFFKKLGYKLEDLSLKKVKINSQNCIVSWFWLDMLNFCSRKEGACLGPRQYSTTSHHILGIGEGLPSTWSSMAKGGARCFGGVSVGAGEQSHMSCSLFFLYVLSLVLVLFVVLFHCYFSRWFLPQLMIFPSCSSNSPLQPVAGGGGMMELHMISGGTLGNTIPKS